MEKMRKVYAPRNSERRVGPSLKQLDPSKVKDVWFFRDPKDSVALQ